MADGQKAIAWLQEHHGSSVICTDHFREQHWAEIKLDDIQNVCRALKSQQELDYDFLVDVTAVHWPDREQSIEIVYHLYSYAHDDRLRLKVRCGDAGPVPSLASIWLSASWNERETYDMFGIRFDGHPDLRRILMHEEYTDFPLRKELPLYRG